jgi:hypothetical protein
MSAALIELTDTHAHLLAGVLLNAGEGFKDVAASVPEDAAEAYVRWLEGEVERLKGQPPCTEGASMTRRLNVRFTTPSAEVAGQIADLYGGRPIVGSEPKTGKGPLGAVAREQIAAYRHATDPGAADHNCPACLHLRTLHGPAGCAAKVYPSHSLDGEPCPCEHAPPTAATRGGGGSTTEERMC